MNLHRISFVAVWAWVPLTVAALELRDQPIAEALLKSPTAGATEARDAKTPVKLRESLKLTLSDSQSSGKPFRLTPEERLKLREQLRDRTDQVARGD